MTLHELLSIVLEARENRIRRAQVRVEESRRDRDVQLAPDEESVDLALGHLVDLALERLGLQRERRLAVRCRALDDTAVIELEYPLEEPWHGDAGRIHEAVLEGRDVESFGLVGCRSHLEAEGSGCRAYVAPARHGSIRFVLEVPISATVPGSAR